MKKEKECVFCQVAKGKIKHHQFWEDENHVAFLNRSPQAFGHTLVIPKRHVGYVFSLHEKNYLELLRVSEKIAKGLQKVTKCKRVCLAIYGFEVNHTHVHLIPFNSLKEVRNHIKKPLKSEQTALEEKLREAVKLYF